MIKPDFAADSLALERLAPPDQAHRLTPAVTQLEQNQDLETTITNPNLVHKRTKNTIINCKDYPVAYFFLYS